MAKHRRLVYLLNEVGGLSKEELGGKGAGLCQLVQAGFPVPAGLVVLSGLSRAWHQEGRLPKRLDWQLQGALTKLERKTGRRFGEPQKPLLLSVRSGAPVSMPGMMETVLNIGLNEEILPGLIQELGSERCGWDTYRRFLESFGTAVLGIDREHFSGRTSVTEVADLQELCRQYRQVILEQTGQPMVDDPAKQLCLTIAAVCHSWEGARADVYRQTRNIPGRLGTAVVVQQMVFGNAGSESGTGVVFSRNVATGEQGLYGEYLPLAQGEELVAGQRTPEPIAKLARECPELYQQLECFAQCLEERYNDVVEIEFTIEQGKLWLLQVRTAKCAPIAAVRIVVDMVAGGRWSKQQAVRRVSRQQLEELQRARFDPEALRAAATKCLLGKGLPASPGAAVGKAVFCPDRAKELAAAGESVILIRQDTTPDDFQGMLAAQAVVTANGGQTCHAAVVARDLGRPAVVGIKKLLVNKESALFPGGFVHQGELVSVDGESGQVVRGAVSLLLSSESIDERVLTFLKWVETYRPARLIQLALSGQRWNVNTLLNDFYLVQAMAHGAEDAVLQQRAQQLFRQIQQQVADVFAVYLLIAVAGELYHAQSCSQQELGDLVWLMRKPREFPEVAALYGLAAGELTSRMLGPLQYAIGLFRDESAWSASCLGGELWARIAETLLWYLQGKFSAAVFVDRVFDLRHNGGRLFDKHSMVREETNEWILSHQLDVKRAATGVAPLAKGLLALHPAVSPGVQTLLEEVERRK